MANLVCALRTTWSSPKPARAGLPSRPIRSTIPSAWRSKETRRGGFQPPSRGIKSSLEGNGIHQAALVPGRVQAAIKFQRARLTYVALEDLGVVAAGFDCQHHPLVLEDK